MKLACNYYRETEELVRGAKIDIDYFKFPALGFQMEILKNDDLSKFESFVQEIKKVKPVLYHGLSPSPHNICSPRFKEELSVDIIERLLKITGTPGISIHLVGADEIMSKEELIKIAVSNISFLKSKFSGVDFISFENGEKSKSIYDTDPEVISQIIRQADADFLLDISHAFWTSNARREDFLSYLHKLPLERVYEIHINGWAEKDGDIMAHVKIHEMGYSVLKHVLEYCSPQIITLEYGRHNDRIGTGCPVMSQDKINEEAKTEIIEQIDYLKKIIGK